MKHNVIRLVWTFVLLSILGLTLCAQQHQVAKDAEAAYKKKAFADGASLFLLAAQFEPKSAYAHLYNAACCYALSAKKDLAFFSLDAAIARGWRDKKTTEEDKDLASLHSDPRWKNALAKIQVGAPAANRDAVINDLNNLAAYSYQYRIRPSSMGGGHGTYLGIKLPKKLEQNANASYEIVSVEENLVQFKATGTNGSGSVEVSIDGDGMLHGWTFSGAFAEPSAAAKQNQTSVDENKDALINDLNTLAMHCYLYHIRPVKDGGGDGFYDGYRMPEKMKTNANGTFTIISIGPDAITIKAASSRVPGAAIESTIDSDGRLGNWKYFGEFQ